MFIVHVRITFLQILVVARVCALSSSASLFSSTFLLISSHFCVLLSFFFSFPSSFTLHPRRQPFPLTHRIPSSPSTHIILSPTSPSLYLSPLLIISRPQHARSSFHELLPSSLTPPSLDALSLLLEPSLQPAEHQPISLLSFTTLFFFLIFSQRRTNIHFLLTSSSFVHKTTFILPLSVPPHNGTDSQETLLPGTVL